LRKSSIQEVLNPKFGIAPKFKGLNVYRVEMAEGLPPVISTLFFKAPAESKFPDRTDEWVNFMKDVQFDKQEYANLEKYLEPGLATPMPALAEISYPELKLEGIEVAKLDKTGMDPMGMGPGSPAFPGGMKPGSGFPVPPPMGGMPGMPMGGTGTEVKVENLDWAKLKKNNKTLYARLKDKKFDFFSPYGDDSLAKKKAQAASYYKTGDDMPGMPGSPPILPPGGEPGTGGEKGSTEIGNPPMPGSPGMGTTSVEIPEYVLVRFVDVDVKPGKTYKYFIQVKLENPNFDKKEKVSNPQMADVKELLSAWTETPSQRVDPEYHYYFVDQFNLLDEKDFTPSATKPSPKYPITKDTALQSTTKKEYDPKTDYSEAIAVQIHQWVEEAIHPISGKVKVGGWGIAQRLLVKKGQFIGKSTLEVPLPAWDNQKGKFVPPATNNKTKLKQPKDLKIPLEEKEGLKVDFAHKDKTPVLVDFKGGVIKGEEFLKNWSPTLKPLNETSKQNNPEKPLFTYEFADNTGVQALVLTPDGKLLAYNSLDDSSEKTDRGKERQEQYSQWEAIIQPGPEALGGMYPGGMMPPGMPGSPGFPGSK
jgi:hypothetical protein